MSQGDSPRLAKGQHWQLDGGLYRLADAELLLVELIQYAGGPWTYQPRLTWEPELFTRAELTREPPAELVAEITAWDAVEDGLLVDATQDDPSALPSPFGVASDTPEGAFQRSSVAGQGLADITRQYFKWPVLYTLGVQSVIQTAIDNPSWANDQRGVWADILTIARSPLARQIDACTRLFTVAIYGLGGRQFKAQSGPSGVTDPRPVVIISLPDED